MNKDCEKSLIRFHEAESRKDFGTSDDVLRRSWRGDTVKRGHVLRRLPKKRTSISMRGMML
jgi:hypothetical protein